MLTYSTLQDRPREFLAATSLTHEEFARVLPAFAAAYAVLYPPDKTWEGNIAPSGRTLLIYDVPDASPTASSHPQVCQRELCHGLCPSPVRSSSWGAPSARTITPTLDRLQLVIDDTITRMPHLPEHHLPVATRTPQRITPRTGQHTIAGGLLRHNAIGPLDQPT